MVFEPHSRNKFKLKSPWSSYLLWFQFPTFRLEMEKGIVLFLRQMKMVFIYLMTSTHSNLCATHLTVIGWSNPKKEALSGRIHLSQCTFFQKWPNTYVQIVVRITKGTIHFKRQQFFPIVGFQQIAKQFYVQNIYDTSHCWVFFS